MGVNLSLYTIILPSIAALIPIFVLWRNYSDLSSDMATRARLAEEVTIEKDFRRPDAPPPKELDPRLALTFEFLILAWLVGIPIAIGITLILYFLKKLSVNLPDFNIFKQRPRVEGPRKAIDAHIKPWLIILGALPLALIAYGLIIYMMGSAKLEDIAVLSLVSERALNAAGLSFSLTCIAAGIAMTFTNQEAVRGMIRQPGLATWYVIIATLAEGIALYGLVITFMIMGKFWITEAADALVLETAALIIGVGALAGGLSMALTMKLSAPEMPDQPFSATWIVILAALGEGIVLYALVIAFMVVGKVEGANMEGAMLLWNSVFKFGGGLLLSGLLVGYLPYFVGKKIGSEKWVFRIIAVIGKV